MGREFLIGVPVSMKTALACAARFRKPCPRCGSLALPIDDGAGGSDHPDRQVIRLRSDQGRARLSQPHIECQDESLRFDHTLDRFSLVAKETLTVGGWCAIKVRLRRF